MSRGLSSDFQAIPPGCIPYDYDRIIPPFTTENTVSLNSVNDFLSDSELAQVRKLETVFFSPVFERVVGSFIPGLRRHTTSSCLYLCRFNEDYYEHLLEGFLDAVHAGRSKADLGGVHEAWFRVTTPDEDRYYPLVFHGDLQGWSDRMITVATEKGTKMGWFDKGTFCRTDGRKVAFGDLRIDRLEGGKPIPRDW